jgi:hypothetical protein
MAQAQVTSTRIPLSHEIITERCQCTSWHGSWFSMPLPLPLRLQEGEGQAAVGERAT